MDKLDHDTTKHNDPSSAAAAPAAAAIRITRRAEKSLLTNLLFFVIRPFKPRLVTVRKGVPTAESQQLTPCRRARNLCDVRERRVDGIWVYDLTRKSRSKSVDGSCETPSGRVRDGKKTKRLVYFAGGGWQMSPSSSHWSLVAEMVKTVPGLVASMVSYPLAPNAPASVSMPQLKKMYDTIMDQAAENEERVILAGDSSGGNISLCLATWAMSDPDISHSRVPAAVLAISPSTDLRNRENRLREVERLDPLLSIPFVQSTAEAWAGGIRTSSKEEEGVPRADSSSEWTAWDPRVSPILADLEPLRRHGVKINCITGTHDVLAVEAHAFRDRCEEEGVEGEWLEWKGQMHCFPLAFPYEFREAVEGVKWIADVLRRT